jgi:multidrug efflux pump subunit AcrB
VTERTPIALTRLAAWPDRHPGFVFLVLILFAVVGTVFAARLPLGRAVPVAPPSLLVQAKLPGIDAATVETTVTLPLEEIVRGLRGIKQIESRTRAGHASMALRFASAAERDGALEDVRQRVATVIPQLPVGMNPPAVEVRDIRPAAVAYAITSDDESSVVEQWVERALAGPLRELPEIASATVEGALEREILIEPDSRRLVALGLSFDDLIQALRRQDEAPPRRGKVRRAMVASGSAESIAMRAVRLPSGDPIALAEVARISAVEHGGTERPYYRDMPALRLAVYPRAAADAPRVAERANAYLAWLRANDLIPPDVAVHAVEDESRAARQSLKDLGQRSAIFLAVTFLATALIFGVRRCGFVASAFAVWLPASLMLLWFFRFTLNGTTVFGFFLAAILFASTILAPWFLRLAGASLGVAALAWLAGEWLAEYRSLASVVVLCVSFGVFIAWLLTPWMHHGEYPPSLVRLLSRRWRNRAELLAVSIFAAVISAAALMNVHAMTTRGPKGDGTFALQVQGNELARLTTVSESLLPPLLAVPGVEDVSFSATDEETWRVQLDQTRLDEHDLTLAEVGRALAVARDGLIVGEIVHAEALYRLRLQLPSGAAGETFERLLLRGERPGDPAVYLRDVGIAVKETQPRERLRIDAKPAVEITARWRDTEARAALERFCRSVSLSEGFKRECNVN